jgi:hypothetical protein
MNCTRLFSLLFFYFTLCCQNFDTITVFLGKPENKLIQFEMEFLNKVVELYNLKHPKKLYLKTIKYKSYQDVYVNIGTFKNKDDLVIGICASTIFIDKVYNERYQFSKPFLPVKSAFIGSSKIKFKKGKKYTLSIVKGVPQYRQMSEVVKSAGYTFKVDSVRSYDDMHEHVSKKISHGYIGDTIDAWLNDDLKIVYEIQKKHSYFGFLYQSGSTLKETLDPTIKYLQSSPIYYRILRKYFGNNFKNYYVKTLENKMR